VVCLPKILSSKTLDTSAETDAYLCCEHTLFGKALAQAPFLYQLFNHLTFSWCISGQRE